MYLKTESLQLNNNNYNNKNYDKVQMVTFEENNEI